MVSLTLLTSLPMGKTLPYILDVIVGGSQSWSGRCREENLLSLTSGPALILVTLYALSYPASDNPGVDSLTCLKGWNYDW
jgi:hypothetical protein